jgi:hypothetical protein
MHPEAILQCMTCLFPHPGNCMAPWTCRCNGSVAQLLRAAAAVEEVTLQQVHHDPELLAALGPAAGTLRALDFTDIEIPCMADEVRAFGDGQQRQDSYRAGLLPM